MQILAATDIRAGAEIHNTYGEPCMPPRILLAVAWACCKALHATRCRHICRRNSCSAARAGEYGNAELLHKYGFVLRDNPFDVVTLDRQHVLNTAGGSLVDRIPQRRQRTHQSGCQAIEST